MSQPRVTVGFCLAHLKTGGIERNVVRLIAPLEQRGVSSVLFLQHKTGDLMRAVPDGVKIIDLGGKGMMGTTRALRTALAEAPVDVLYTATNALNIAALRATNGMAQPPATVVGEHIPLEPFLASRKAPWLRRALMRWTYPRASAFVAPATPLIAEHEALLGTHCPPTQVLPNPVVTEIAAPKAQPEQVRNIVSLGRLTPEKDFDLALQAFAKTRAARPQATLTLWGEGPERAALEARIKALGLENHVTLPGVTDDVAGVLSSADLFLCTSKVEGFGNAIVEAQAAGVPVLSVDCPYGPRILLQDGKAGCLVASRDAEGLADAIISFGSDANARDKAAEAAREVAARYTIDASAEAHAEFFKDISRG